MHRALAVVLAASVILGTAGTAQAREPFCSWAPFKPGATTYVKWCTWIHPGEPKFSEARRKAIRRARVAHWLWLQRERRSPRYVVLIIRQVFGQYGGQALRVAACESGYRVTARNGQYFGVFQMGSSERAQFGGSSLSAWDQVRAAHRYFVASGLDWSPWACKP
jgi:hypothetical protein